MSMDFETWLMYGIQHKFVGPIVCTTHDGMPLTALEEEDLYEGGEPCIHILRLYEDANTAEAVEANHAPSTWRKRWNTNPTKETN